MNRVLALAGSLLLTFGAPAQAASVYVQHLGDVSQNAILAFSSGPGFTLNADLLAGEFHIFADASPSVPANNNFSGIFNSVEFTNNTGVAVMIAPGGLHGSVEADFFNGPSAGGQHNTNMRTSGILFARVLGGTGLGDFVASFQFQTSVFYNLDGSIRDVTSEYLPNATNGASVVAGPGGGLGGANVVFAMPALQLDPLARMQVTFQIGGDAADSSTTNVLGKLGLQLPAGVVLTNNTGHPLAWVTSVPEPSTYALMLAGLGLVGYAVRRRKRA